MAVIPKAYIEYIKNIFNEDIMNTMQKQKCILLGYISFLFLFEYY